MWDYIRVIPELFTILIISAFLGMAAIAFFLSIIHLLAVLGAV